MEAQLDKMKREVRQSEDKAFELKANLDKRKQSHEQDKEDEAFARKETRFERTELEDKISDLMAENSSLQDENERLRSMFDNQAVDERNEVLQLTRELEEVQSCLEEEKEKERLHQIRLTEAAKDKSELDKVQSELNIAKNDVERLESELKLNEDAVIERKAMRQRLDHYPQIVRENEALRAENQLLHDTAENSALLKTKAEDLELKLAKAESEVEIGQTAKEQLYQTSRQIKRWQEVCLQILSEEERNRVGEGSVGVEILRQKIAEFQRKEIYCQEEIKTLEAKISTSDHSNAQLKSEKEKLNKEVASGKDALNQQKIINS